MNHGFQSDYAVVRSSDGQNFTLVYPIVYITAIGARITIPAGTTTDGASVPRALWRLLPPFGKYWMASILHDYVYRFTKMAKTNCDDLFHEAMLSCGVDPAVARTIYEGVRIGGQEAFDENRRQLASAESIANP